MYDVESVRKDFPVLGLPVNGKPNTFLDSGASAQKPRQVIDKMVEVYTRGYSNVHRGSYYLSEEITSEYEQARQKLPGFLMPKARRKSFLRATQPSQST